MDRIVSTCADAQDLDRDATAEPRVLGRVHDALSASAEPFEQAVTTEMGRWRRPGEKRTAHLVEHGIAIRGIRDVGGAQELSETIHDLLST
jgi:hypothetical protein